VTDILILSLGTTRGLRVADALLVALIEEAGASAEAVTLRFGAAGKLRRGYPVNDIVEAVAARRALAGALARDRPRALLFSTTTAALLADPGGLPYAVRLDAPAALNRPGLRNAPVRALERRSLHRARLVLALGAAGAAALPASSARAEIVPVPIDPFGDPSGPRDDRLAVAYVPDPKAKGLDVLVAGWIAAARTSRALAGARLDVYGIERERALRFLARTGVEVPDGVEFRGLVASDTFRGALRDARVYVSAARWEDFGQAPLEALRDGAQLVTTPAGGPYEALDHARALDADLVARDGSHQALARALSTAFLRDGAARKAYREAAAARLEGYRSEAVVTALRERVLPVLVG
jgi:hypothetical protein